MDTLFFVISICGFVVITFWAYLNDRCAEVGEQNGLLAMKAPVLADGEEPAPEVTPTLEADTGTATLVRSQRQPRRRFISS